MLGLDSVAVCLQPGSPFLRLSSLFDDDSGKPYCLTSGRRQDVSFGSVDLPAAFNLHMSSVQPPTSLALD